MSDMICREMTETDQYLQQFLNNLKDQHTGIGNIYVARTVDKNGKTTDVKFGKNMMTDYGMLHFFISKDTFPKNMYIGYGSTSVGFNHTSSSLVEPYDTVSTLVSETRDYAYPMYFDPVSGLITCVCRALQVKFPATISGLPDEISITEYGIGTANNALWTHSWVYDTLGRYGTLIKRPEEELFIDVYYCMCYNESMILDEWTNGRYIVITTMQRFFDRMTGKIIRFRRDNKGMDCTSTASNTAFQNNEVTNYRNLTNFTMTNSWSGTEATDKANGYFDCFGDWTSGFSLIEREVLTTPEPINAIVAPSGHKDNCISNCFGKFNQTSLPLTQANIVSCKRYNYNTGEWDIAESFYNDPDMWYTETFLQTYIATPIYYTNNQTILGLWLFRNMKTDDPITAFDLNLETVYAAEKYWDKTTWHFLSNIAQIPNNDTNEYNHTMNCQTARYYITNSSSISLVPHRTKHGFEINPVCGSMYNKTPWSVMDGAYALRPIFVNSSVDGQWFCYGDFIYSFKYNKYYKFSAINNPFTYMGQMGMWTEGNCMAYGNWIMWTPHYKRGYNIICYMNMSDLSVIPTIIDNRLYVDGNNNISYAASLFLMSETGTGYIALQGRNYSTGYVYNLKTDASTSPALPSPTQYATKQLCCIWGTERIAYIEAADTSHIKIYEFGSTNDVVITLDLPSGFTPAYMFGHTNYLWVVSNNSSVAALCYDLLTGTSVNCNVAMSWFCDTNNTYRIRMTAVEECLVIYRSDPNYSDGNTYAWFYIEISKPNVVNNFSVFSEIGSDQNYGGNYFNLSKLGNTIILLHSMRNYYTDGSYNHIYDFGLFLKTGTKYVTKLDYTGRYNSAVVPYGDQFICNISEIAPKEYFIPHKLIGTTPTITSLNHYVNVRNKQYHTTFSNITDFRGLPPGDKQ